MFDLIDKKEQRGSHIFAPRGFEYGAMRAQIYATLKPGAYVLAYQFGEFSGRIWCHESIIYDWIEDDGDVIKQAGALRRLITVVMNEIEDELNNCRV